MDGMKSDSGESRSIPTAEGERLTYKRKELPNFLDCSPRQLHLGDVLHIHV